MVEDSPLLTSLFDSPVVARVCTGTPLMTGLYPEEARHVASAVAVRQAHFTAGRLSAHAALEALGVPSRPLLADAARAPVWPTGVVGSITHTDGFCGAVVAPRTRYCGLGIDAEQRAHVTEELWREILTSAELRWLREQPASQRAEMATVMFCAKEAFYKCQYQVTGAWLGFEAAEVAVNDRAFLLSLLQTVGELVAGQEFSGRFAVLPSIIVAGIAITAP